MVALHAWRGACYASLTLIGSFGQRAILAGWKASRWQGLEQTGRRLANRIFAVEIIFLANGLRAPAAVFVRSRRRRSVSDPTRCAGDAAR